ncbi:DeoR/GlpR transcriptional regulator, partial [Thioclava sp. BHET1]
IHGGAVPPRLDQERPLIERGKHNARSKGRVAELADPLLQDGMSVFLDTGTTTMALARRLIGRNITVTTNSLDIALLLGSGVPQVRLTPGTLRIKDNALVGYETMAYVRKNLYDMALMGISAVDPRLGWMDYEEHESVLRQNLQQHARQSIILADYDKFGIQAHFRTFPLNTPLTVVCDRAPPEHFLKVFAANDIETIYP